MSWRRLPEDIQLEILCLLEPLQLVKTRQVNRRLCALVDSSKRTQLIVELARSGYSLACHLGSLPSVTDVLGAHLSWRENILNFPKGIDLEAPVDNADIEMLVLFGDSIFIQDVQDTVYSFSLRKFAQSGMTDWVALQPCNFILLSILHVDIARNALFVRATELDSMDRKLLVVNLGTLERLPGSPEILMDDTQSTIISGFIISDKTLAYIVGSTGILRAINWQTGHPIGELAIGTHYLRSLALFAGHILLFVRHFESKIAISVHNLHNPSVMTLFYLPRMAEGYELTWTGWVAGEGPQENDVLSSKRPHNICVLKLALKTSSVPRTVKQGIVLVIKFNNLLRFPLDKAFDWPEWGQKCARFLPIKAGMNQEIALNGSRLILWMQEVFSVAESTIQQSSNDKAWQVTILDFNPGLASNAMDVVEGSMDIKPLADIFARPKEATDGVAFSVLRPHSIVVQEHFVPQIYMTESAMVVEQENKLEVIWFGDPC